MTSHRLGAIAGALAIVFASTFGAGLPVGSAGAQVPPTPPAPATTVTDDVMNNAINSVGVVTGQRHIDYLGWVASDGVVVTSDLVTDSVGVSVPFTIPASKRTVDCYVAKVETKSHLAYLRCGNIGIPPLGIANSYPAPGGSVFLVEFLYGSSRRIVARRGAIIGNDIEFMGSRRLQFSFLAPSEEVNIPSPVLDADGKVVSWLFVSPASGGNPLGVRATTISDEVSKILPLPSSFKSAALLAISKRAVIPAAVGLLFGLIWGLLSRNGTVLVKTLGLGGVGLLLTILYTVFTALVIGPESFIG